MASALLTQFAHLLQNTRYENDLHQTMTKYVSFASLLFLYGSREEKHVQLRCFLLLIALQKHVHTRNQFLLKPCLHSPTNMLMQQCLSTKVYGEHLTLHLKRVDAHVPNSVTLKIIHYVRNSNNAFHLYLMPKVALFLTFWSWLDFVDGFKMLLDQMCFFLVRCIVAKIYLCE